MAADFFETYTANVVATLREAIAKAGLTAADITMVIPHNVNRSSWRRIIPELGLGEDRIYLDNVSRYGHCFCSDPFLNLVSLRDEGRLASNGIYLLATVGLGATYAAMVIEGQGLS
jgi:3-oxoacyl-[acyl-carrier-protein] synthase-3